MLHHRSLYLVLFFAGLALQLVNTSFAIEPQSNPEEVFLDDLKEVAFEVNYGTLGKYGQTGFPPNTVAKCRLKSQATELKHALALHPLVRKSPNDPKINRPAFVAYKLDGRFTRFRATAALNYPVPQDGLGFAKREGWTGSAGSKVVFRVRGDGREIWQSSALQANGDSEKCDVSIVGVKELRLEVECLDSERFAWSFWANPVVSSEANTLTSPNVASTTSAAPANAPTDEPVTAVNSAMPQESETEEVVQFNELVLEAPATSFDMTEDGLFLIVTHQGANLVSIYDVLERNVAKVVNCPAPRSVLCRGDSIFVANHGEATVSVISRSRDWRVTEKLKVAKPNIVHMSAPALPHFKNELLVVCHGDGVQGSYQGCQTYLLQTRRPQCREVDQSSSISVSSDGKYVYSQSSFNLSPSGGISVYPYKNFISKEQRGQPTATGGIAQTPYVYQVPNSTYWLSQNLIFGGIPVQQIKGEFGKLLVPDLSQKLFYTIDENVVRARRYDTAFSELSQRQAEYPQAYADFATLSQHLFRTREYLLDHPMAYTHSDRLHLFVMSGKGGMVLSSETKAFQARPVSAPKDRSSTAANDSKPPADTDANADANVKMIPGAELASQAPTANASKEAPATAAVPSVSSSSSQATNQPKPSADLSDTIERCEQSVVRIEVETKNGGGQGSGFLINSRILATNVHVLAGAETATVKFPDGLELTIEGTLYVDPERDIAIAQLSESTGQPIPVLPLSTAMPRKGQRVTALGSPLGLSFTATSGVVSAIRPADEIARELNREGLSGTWVQIDAALSPGNSGGPIINDAGEVVAMSTLASQAAQNLNFGISSNDIREALEASHGKQPVPLSEEDVLVQEGAKRSESKTGSTKIPPQAIQDYVKRGRAEFADLKRSLTQEMSRLRSDLKEMRSGVVGFPSSLRNTDAEVVRTTVPGKKVRTWFFRTENIKTAEIEAAETRLKDLGRISAQTNDPNDAETLLTLLWKYGPAVETREVGSVGFLSDCIVFRAYNANEVLVVQNEVPYLLVLDSTAGLWLGREVVPLPVYVAGTATAEGREGGSTTLTVLRSLNREQLKMAVTEIVGSDKPQTKSSPGASPKPSNGSDKPSASAAPGKGKNALRVWRDQSGKFSIEATLVEVTPTEAVLKKADGSTLRVPRNKLSDEDQKLLDSN